jgi:hypothetical protein
MRVWLALSVLFLSVSTPVSAQKSTQVLDSIALHKIDSSNAVAARLLAKRDSQAKAVSLAIALRDTINNPRPLRPEQIRADRREHAFAIGAVSLLGVLTFLLYNLRSQ